MKWFLKKQLEVLLRLFWRKFLHVFVFRSPEHNGSYFRNQFGSIISPLEFRIAWDTNLTERVMALNRLISPSSKKTKKLKLVRVGSVGDGGYFLPETYRNCDGAISGGISDNNDFEYELALGSIPVIQFDHTIDEPPKKLENMYFKRVKLGNDGYTLSDTVSAFTEITGREIKNGILKLDIEGSEFDFLANTNAKALSIFDVIVAELHFLGEIYKDVFWENVKNSLNLIRQNHKPIFLTGNNSRPYVQLGGIPICDIIEITFVRNNAPVPFYDEEMKIAMQIQGRAPLRIHF